MEAHMWALISSTNRRDHFLKVSRKIDIFFTLQMASTSARAAVISLPMRPYWGYMQSEKEKRFFWKLSQTEFYVW